MSESDNVRRYRGEVVYVYAFDVAAALGPAPAAGLLGAPIVNFSIGANKRTPRDVFYYPPQMVRLPPVERTGPRGPVQLQRTVKLFPVGAFSLAVYVPFEVGHIEELVDYHDLQLNGAPLQAEVMELAERIRRELAPCCVRPVARLREEEAYTVFCLRSPLTTPEGQALKAEEWLLRHRRPVAALLTQEPDMASLSHQEAVENTAKYLSYYEDDLTVIDWDAALVVDRAENLDETLHIIELANVQLAELEEYDRLLDEAMSRSYRDLTRRPYFTRGEILDDLREIRVDLTRLSDELSNITKFFGDWHLARIYQSLSARFHLSDWHATIDEKLKTLDGLYQMLKQDQNNRLMLVLEITIVVLFVLDLIILLIVPMK
jgi:hypothetical protein